MNPSPNVKVEIDLAKIRQNAAEIKRKVGVTVFAVVKADGYGLGVTRVADVLKDIVDGFCVFRASEATDVDLKQFGKPILALGPPENLNAEDYLSAKVQPTVSTVEQATALERANPSVCVDVGMQRFACAPENLDAVIRAGEIRDAFCHGTRVEHALRLKELLGARGMRLMAGATSMLNEPRGWLDGIRPGFAIYDGSVRVTTKLIEARDSREPAGYTGFTTKRFGIILAGYSNAMIRNGIVLVNGVKRKVIEVGMQSTFIEIGEQDKAGDEVVLLGDSLNAREIADAAKISPHEVLVRLTSSGERRYEG